MVQFYSPVTWNQIASYFAAILRDTRTSVSKNSIDIRSISWILTSIDIVCNGA